MVILATLQNLSASGPLAVSPGDQVRVKALSISATWIKGTVLALSADSLLLEQQKSPFYTRQLAIPLHCMTEIDVKSSSTARWQEIPIPQTYRDMARSLEKQASRPEYPVDQPSYWGSAEVGISSIDGFSVAGTAAYQIGTRQVLLNYVYAEEFLLFEEHPPNKASCVGLLYGKVSRRRKSQTSVSAGIGIVSGTRVESRVGETRWGWSRPYETTSYTTLGVPLVARLSWQQTSLGLGLTAYANLNSEKLFGGISIFLKLGRIP